MEELSNYHSILVFKTENKEGTLDIGLSFSAYFFDSLMTFIIRAGEGAATCQKAT